ncbi:MAG TPA: HAMP domain-containing sensor histidine kinase [Bacteroidia bacterium]|nr:HAMP domain-containing sensor histidine kinase [Bacteroidia bacterium]HNS12595.1 HAMP domain-containing sensor histidine kinase [Bacteroidia bacterium]
MKTRSKNTTGIGLLMLCSQLVLLAFTGHWLYSQYLEAKSQLTKDIERQLTDAKLEVVDSMLVLHLINPILNDEKGFKLHMAFDDEDSIETDTLRSKDRVRSFTFVQAGDSGMLPGMISGKVEKKIEYKNLGDSASDIFVKGVKLIFDEVRSSVEENEYVKFTEFQETDSVLLKRIFNENLAKNKLSLPVKWVQKDSLEPSGSNVIFFETRLYPFSYGPEVSEYRSFLIGKIFPQILFAIILVLLTGAAFYISFRSLQDQMRLSALKNDFISNISHELKTPVSTVKVAVEALQDRKRNNDPEKVHEYLGMASLEIKRLELLIDKVLDTSTLEGRKDFIQPEEVNLNLLITEVLNSFQPRVESMNAQIEFVAGSDNIIAHVDKLHFQGVIINLIDNSIKYSNGPIRLKIELQSSNDTVIIKIQDNGPGIPNEYLDKVFEKFFRVPSENVHNVKGSGLGLSYASMVIEQHGGSISVKNLKPVGCIFTIKLPKK